MDTLSSICGLGIDNNIPSIDPITPQYNLIRPNTPLTLEFISFLDSQRFLVISAAKCTATNKRGRVCGNSLLPKALSSSSKVDGYSLTCSSHGKVMGLRNGSFFYNDKWAITTIIYVIHHYSCAVSTSSIKMLLFPTKVKKDTLTNILRSLQERMIPILQKKKPIFDTGDELEIDEMWLKWKAESGT